MPLIAIAPRDFLLGIAADVDAVQRVSLWKRNECCQRMQLNAHRIVSTRDFRRIFPPLFVAFSSGVCQLARDGRSPDCAAPGFPLVDSPLSGTPFHWAPLAFTVR